MNLHIVSIVIGFSRLTIQHTTVRDLLAKRVHTCYVTKTDIRLAQILLTVSRMAVIVDPFYKVMTRKPSTVVISWYEPYDELTIYDRWNNALKKRGYRDIE